MLNIWKYIKGLEFRFNEWFFVEVGKMVVWEMKEVKNNGFYEFLLFISWVVFLINFVFDMLLKLSFWN